jgi:hypothetical protein
VKNPELFYDHTFELFEDVIPDDPETKYNKFGRYLQLNLRKKDSDIWWPRLAKTSNKLHHVRIDWEKWADDDGMTNESSKRPSKKASKKAKPIADSSATVSEAE